MTYEPGVEHGVNLLEDEMITRMWEHTQEFGWAFSLNFFAPMHREVARGMLRKMAGEGKVEHTIGLWTEDGTMAGAGYMLTQKTTDEMRLLDALSRQPLPVNNPEGFG